jgi:CBS domain-containing protein
VTTARDIMHRDAECIGENDSLVDAARKMRDLGVGALPICGKDDRLHGIITDRDIVVKCLAEGRDPAMARAADLAQGAPFYVEENTDLDEVTRRMMDHRIKRLPVVADQRLVGMISEADLARNLSEDKLGHFVGAIKSGPADTIP